jgi:hypothetical protein
MTLLAEIDHPRHAFQIANHIDLHAAILVQFYSLSLAHAQASIFCSVSTRASPLRSRSAGAQAERSSW